VRLSRRLIRFKLEDVLAALAQQQEVTHDRDHG
jgi:hypothetical protein